MGRVGAYGDDTTMPSILALRKRMSLTVNPGHHSIPDEATLAEELRKLTWE